MLWSVIGYVTEIWVCCPKCGGRTISYGVSEVEQCTSCGWREI